MYFEKLICIQHICDRCNRTQHCVVPHEVGKGEERKELCMETLVIESEEQLLNFTGFN